MLDYNLYPNGLLKHAKNQNISFNFKNDDLIIITNKNAYKLSEMKVTSKNNSFIYSADDAVFTLQYDKTNETSFLTRKLTAQFNNSVQLLKIGIYTDSFNEKFLYETFYNASAAVFCRNANYGLCCGFENPYCELDGDFLFFEPSLILREKEIFECDLNFYGLYEISGEKIQPCLYKSQMHINGRYQPRYRNPGEGTALYFSEIKEFNNYTANYFDCENKEFKFTSYNFFGNLPQRPQTEEEFNTYLEHIDAFADMGGDTIILNPLFPNKIPDKSPNSYWELFPENTYARKIYDYAKRKKLKIGIYTGTAGNGEYGNSSMISYAANSQWKKIDVKGNLSKENCIADDDFADWFIKVQINTIKEYNLSVWNWDPGPGHAFFCFSEDHGHLPGKGAYKGFRNSLKIMKALKDEFPNLYYQGFHGNKEYGLWGFKYIDQHEAYWENEIYVMNPIFNDLSADRASADGIRFQSIWNYYFRFMPATLNHGISHRMLQACWMGQLNFDKVFDFCGYKYALLSCIAAGGPITQTITPRKPELIPGYKEFYSEWISFAKNIFNLSKYTIPFGDQTGCGLDGFAKILNNNGYIFMFNPFNVDLTFNFTISDRLGFENDCKPLPSAIIYPYKKQTATYNFGDVVHQVIPAYGCVILQIGDSSSEIQEEQTVPALHRVLQSKSKGKFEFFAHNAIKELVDSCKSFVTQETEDIYDKYLRVFERTNTCWGRPDRLWLSFTFEGDYSQAKIFINDNQVDLKLDIYKHNELVVNNMFFADITDVINWEQTNVITIDGIDLDNIYLHYPKQQNEQLPLTTTELKVHNCEAPLLDNNIVITHAQLNADNIMVPEKENEPIANVNIPAKELEGVYASVPISIGNTGYELRRDMALEYTDGAWRKNFFSGSRMSLIIDDCKIVIWAVTKDKKESASFKLPINWLLN